MDSLSLTTMDRDGALEASLDGLTRAQALRAGALGLVGAAGLGALTAAPASAAASRKTDLMVLQFALVLEHLGVKFYSEALKSSAITGDTKTFARTVHAHEVDHLKIISGVIRSLGGKPGAAPKFDFGDTTSDASRFRQAAANLEQLCVGTLNGAAPLLSKPVLAGASMLVSVEARHVSWIENIRDVHTPVPGAFDTPLTAAQAKRQVKGTGFVKGAI